MIKVNENQKIFYLEMKDASYLFGVGEMGHLIHYYYGKRLEGELTKKDFDFTPYLELGSSTTHSKSEKPLNLNLQLLEIATYGKGDYREPTIHIETGDGYRSLEFLYQSHSFVNDLHFNEMPQAKKDETLQITMKESTYDILLKLNYTVDYEHNTIIRNIELINHEEMPLTLDRMLSANFDFKTKAYELMTLDGAWIRERHLSSRSLDYGIIKIDSKKGVSSSDHNPFILLKALDATKNAGDIYAFHLIYSGNFEANIEVSPHDLLRVNMGINSFDFKWSLEKGEHFITPEVISTFSPNGIIETQKLIHEFIENKIVNHKNPRPVLLNNWEATYFDFNEKKLLQIAKKAKGLGIEGFVLDDGWFGQRDDDTTSLGDWVEHPKKLKRGLAHLSKRIKKQGLLFGLWVEPEMVSEQSDLYKAHPNWAIKHPKARPAKGRNQLILDLSNPEVVDSLYLTLENVFERAAVDVVKWDMNRNFSDLYSHHLKSKDQGKLMHRYTLGLYRLLERLKSRFPNVLFESCASGGNRFDLGMHYYMPQAWTSDNTDAYERLKIQSGSYLAYPQSIVSNHVNDQIAHQTIRNIPIETRFNVAAFGILGYELDPRGLSAFDQKIIKKQIAFYKNYRDLFQYGTLFDLSIDEHDYRYLVVSKDQKKAIFGIFEGLASPNPKVQSFKLTGLNPKSTYHISSRDQYENLRRFGGLIKHALPIKMKPHGMLFNTLANHYLMKVESFEDTQKGDYLMANGLNLAYRFTATGYHEKARMMMDFSSRLYLLEEVENGIN